MAKKKPVLPSAQQIIDRLLYHSSVTVEEGHTLRQSMMSTLFGEGIDSFVRSRNQKDVKILVDSFSNGVKEFMETVMGGHHAVPWPVCDESSGDFPPLATYTIGQEQHEPGVVWMRSSLGEGGGNPADVEDSFLAAIGMLSYLTDQNVRACIPQESGPDLDFLVTRDDSLEKLMQDYAEAKDKAAGEAEASA